jgi:hypothetical protein
LQHGSTMLQDRSTLSMTECESVIGRFRRCAAGRTISILPP